MGNISTGISHKLHPDVVPGPNHKPQFDPLYGFPEGRKEKQMIATEEEMMSAKIPLDKRNFCAHILIEYQACRKREFPLLYRCHHDKHHYLECEYKDWVLRVKFFGSANLKHFKIKIENDQILLSYGGMAMLLDEMLRCDKDIVFQYVDRMKDWERERRLLEREKRKGRLNPIEGA